MRKERPDTRQQAHPKLRLKLGDTVEIISGKDRGGRGQITEVLRDEQRVRVSGLALITKHQKGGRSRTMQQQAGRIQMPGKVHVSNVMLVCGTCGKTTRPKVEFDDAGAKRRVCRHCGAAIARTGGEE